MKDAIRSHFGGKSVLHPDVRHSVNDLISKSHSLGEGLRKNNTLDERWNNGYDSHDTRYARGKLQSVKNERNAVKAALQSTVHGSSASPREKQAAHEMLRKIEGQESREWKNRITGGYGR